jgi:predicted RNA-binding protein (virulence factor B family)
MTPEQTGQALNQAGWRLDVGFSEDRIVGHDGHASIIAHSWVWEKDTQVFELNDERTQRIYWVHAIPTPWQAKLLLEEHSDSSEQEKMGTTYELGQYGYASS